MNIELKPILADIARIYEAVTSATPGVVWTNASYLSVGHKLNSDFTLHFSGRTTQGDYVLEGAHTIAEMIEKVATATASFKHTREQRIEQLKAELAKLQSASASL